MNYVLMSIRPRFAEAILECEKTIELRRKVGRIAPGDRIFIYATTPVCRVIGMADVDWIIECDVDHMWNCYAGVLGIDRVEIERYFDGVDKAFGIRLSKPVRFEPVELDFYPPQSYRFLNPFEPEHGPIFGANGQRMVG